MLLLPAQRDLEFPSSKAAGFYPLELYGLADPMLLRISQGYWDSQGSPTRQGERTIVGVQVVITDS